MNFIFEILKIKYPFSSFSSDKYTFLRSNVCTVGFCPKVANCFVSIKEFWKKNYFYSFHSQIYLEITSCYIESIILVKTLDKFASFSMCQFVFFLPFGPLPH